MTAPLEFAVADRVATLTLSRPERMNAFDAALHDALRDALDQIEGDPSIAAVIVTGAGRGFCAGQDLGERAAAFARGETPDLGESLGQNYNPLIERLTALPCPVIAAVNGIASGAGAALAIACDIVLAGASARFQFGFVRVALGPDAGTSWLLPRRVGHGRALALALTGEAIDAERALAIGLCDRVVAEEALIEAAEALASQFASGPVSAIRTIKQALRAEAPAGLAAALTAEQSAQRTLGHHRDYREAVTAFAAKRAPNFREEESS
jgi:2-(1,2-epoxy-1,2-dihydrophenyl)acetyl-CoA isomerase